MAISSSQASSFLGELAVLGSGVEMTTASSLPLEHVAVQGQVVGMLASFALEQRFANPWRDPIELIYRFAIPDNAALAELTIQIGQRRIEAEIAPRQDATQLYRETVEGGRRAALATEERPNLYTLQIGNVQPAETIVVTVRYSMPVCFEGGQYELVLPFGLTPRYDRGDASPDEIAKTRIEVAPPGTPTADLELTLAIDAGVPIKDPVSPSDQLDLTRLDARRCLVRLVEPRSLTRDFVLRYSPRSARGQIASAAWLASDRNEWLVYATFVPPTPDRADLNEQAREYVFVLDRSGSMSGQPIAQARNALRAALRTLNPTDTFRILTFDSCREWFRPHDRAAAHFTDANVADADCFLESVDGRDGTDLLPALEDVLTLPRDTNRPRVIVLLTDGAVSAEDQVGDLVRRGLEERDRFFCFGIGPAVNRYLLNRLSRLGRGASDAVGLDEDIEGAIIRFQDRLSYPVLTDLHLEAPGAVLGEVYPSPLPDLYAGQVLSIVARVQRTDPARRPGLVLSGRRGSEHMVLEIAEALPSAEPLIPRLWGQQQIDALLEAPAASRNESKIVALSIDHHILTPFTALLAVDREVTSAHQPPRRIFISTPLPDGLASAPFRSFYGNVNGPVQSPARFHALGQAFSGIAPLLPQSLGWRNGLASPPSEQPGIQDSSATYHSSGPGSRRLSREVVDLRLRLLARQQRVSGAWGDDGESVEETAAAVVAFARAGHTRIRGSYRTAITRALRWLESEPRFGEDQAFLLWALAEVAYVDGDAVSGARLSRVVADLKGGAASVLSEAVIARLEALSGQAPLFPTVLDLDDARVAVILARVPKDGTGDVLSLAWQACLGSAQMAAVQGTIASH